MATAAWRPESRRHLPDFYSSENSEEPYLTTEGTPSSAVALLRRVEKSTKTDRSWKTESTAKYTDYANPDSMKRKIDTLV